MLLLMSSCKSPDDFEYAVAILSPDPTAIYYTDILNGAGESLGPETVEIIAEITGNEKMRSVGVQIRNSSLQTVYDESFDAAEGLFDYTVNTTFQTDIAGVYDIYVITTYGSGQSSFVRVWQSNSDSFEYKNIDNNGGDGGTDGPN